MQVGRVRIARLVAVLVMAAMQSDPADQVSLHCHRTERGQNESDHGVGLKRAMGEQAVEADGDTQRGQNVHAQKQAEMNPAESPPPKEDSCDCKAGKRHDDRRQIEQAYPKGHALLWFWERLCGWALR